MKVFSDTFPADSLSAFEQHFIRENMLFVDIETTGPVPRPGSDLLHRLRLPEKGPDLHRSVFCRKQRRRAVHTESLFPAAFRL